MDERGGVSQTPTATDYPASDRTRTQYKASNGAVMVEGNKIQNGPHNIPINATDVVHFFGLDGSNPIQAPNPTTGSSNPPTTAPATTGGTGSGTIVNTASNLCLDITGNVADNGTAAQLWDCNGQDNQKFTQTSAKELRTLGKCLDVTGQGTTNGSTVQLWDCNGQSNQQWTVGTDGTIRAQNSGLCLDATGQGTTDGTAIQIWDCNGQTNQQWKVSGATTTGTAPSTNPATTSAPVSTTAPATGGNSSSGTTVVNSASNLCLDIAGNVADNGTAAQLWDCNGQDNQTFTQTSAKELRTLGKCLDVTGQGTTDGSTVQLWDCNGQSNQQWTVGTDGTIRAQNSGLCLDATGQGTTDGTAIQIWDCNGQTNQKWKTTGTTTVVNAPPATTAPASATSCSVAPVDPQATRQAKNLLCYLYSQYGNHILSGQQQDGNGENEFTYIHDKTGKYPVVRGEDIGDGQPGQKALDWWNAGGIPMIGYHMGSPARSDDGYTSATSTASINAALTAGTTDNQRLNQRLDGVAAQLKIVQDGGGAVLWRPYHEAGGTWFWWSKESGSQYVRLWQYTFNYMTKTKGLHNLVWLMPYDGTPQASFWPGKQYVDVAGADNYAANGDYGPMNNLYNQTKNIVGPTIPIALHENGPLPDPDQLKNTGTKWVLFNTWARDYINNTAVNSVAEVQKVYSSPYVVTRDEVPNLK